VLAWMSMPPSSVICRALPPFDLVSRLTLRRSARAQRHGLKLI